MDLTVCTVSHYSQAFLDLNIELTRALNPGLGPEWLIVDNTPEETYRFSAPPANGVRVIEGVSFDSTRARPGSHHHGAALNKGVRAVTTRFVAVLDPDFFIVGERWIQNVVTHMLEHDLAFFGAPWHPRWYTKYRYFPCVHFMVIDLSKVFPEHLDFRPVDDPVSSTSGSGGQLLRRIWDLLPGGIGSIVKNVGGRLFIGTSHDTGSRIRERYRDGCPPGVACLLPVVRPTDYLPPAPVLGRLLDRAMPERFSYTPKVRASVAVVEPTLNGKALPASWETFMWRSVIFGVHLRRTQADEPEAEALIQLRSVLSTVSKSLLPR